MFWQWSCRKQQQNSGDRRGKHMSKHFYLWSVIRIGSGCVNIMAVGHLRSYKWLIMGYLNANICVFPVSGMLRVEERKDVIEKKLTQANKTKHSVVLMWLRTISMNSWGIICILQISQRCSPGRPRSSSHHRMQTLAQINHRPESRS